MSKSQNNIVYLPQELKVNLQKYQNGSIIWIYGPNMTLVRYWKRSIIYGSKLEMTNVGINIKPTDLSSAQDFYKLYKYKDKKKQNEYVGFVRSQLQKSLMRAMRQSRKYLIVRGVGYRFEPTNRYICVFVGYSHQINIFLPSEIRVKLNRKSTKLKFQYVNDQALFQFISTIRKKPDVYKGKGLRYKNEKVLRKEGKKKKTF